jgi:hypothetical protein
VLAWDAFRAPRFPSDEALKRARVAGLDFDQHVKNWVCESKGDDLILWDSVTRHRNGKLRHMGEECMLDTLHWAAKIAREQNTGAAKNLIEGSAPIGRSHVAHRLGSAAERASARRAILEKESRLDPNRSRQ